MKPTVLLSTIAFLALTTALCAHPDATDVVAAAAADNSCAATGEASYPSSSVLSELRASLSSLSSGGGGDGGGEWFIEKDAVRSAVEDLDRSGGSGPGRRLRRRIGASALDFFVSLASSESFRKMYWRRRPLLFRSSLLGARDDEEGDSDSDGGGGRGSYDPGWAQHLFTVERDLRLLDGSYVSGRRTSEAVRGTARSLSQGIGGVEMTWEGDAPIKDDPQQRTRWSDVTKALKGGTIYFNHAGLSFSSLASICRLATAAFGLPANINVYATPPLVSTSIPPHTDRQDVLVIQSTGSKRWRVWASPAPRKMGVDPFHRGKGGDLISAAELGDGPLLDAILRPGDVLYVPAGFPHATDTVTVVADRDNSDEGEQDTAGNIFNDTSVHLTLGLDTNVWGLTFVHLRQLVLLRSGKDPRLGALASVDDNASWDATGTVPVGFLAYHMTNRSTTLQEETCKGSRLRWDGRHAKAFVRELKEIILRLEPNRWVVGSDKTDGINEGAAELLHNERIVWRNRPKETLPRNSHFFAIAQYVLCIHLPAALEAQEAMYSRVTDPRDDSMLLEMRQLSQNQNEIMRRFREFGQPKAKSKDEKG